MPEEFWRKSCYIFFRQYGPFFAEGSRCQHDGMALVGTLYWLHHRFSGWYCADDPG